MSPRTKDPELREQIIGVLNTSSEPLSTKQLAEHTGTKDLEHLRSVLFRMARDADLTTNTNWNYKLATKLKE